MSFDGIMTHQVVNELNQTLATGRINKVQQPYDKELILSIRAHRTSYKLLLSAHPVYARAQLTTIPYQNPDQPPVFCMTLRKYLEGAIIEKIEQYENDRIINIMMSNRDDIGDLHHLMLSLEIMGRHSNLLLIDYDEQKIIDCIKHVSMSQNSYRTLLPGASYIMPPMQEKKNPFTMSKTALFSFLHEETLTASSLMATFQGLGRDTAKELASRLNQHEHKAEAWDQFFSELAQHPQPTLITSGLKQSITPVDYYTIDGQRDCFVTYSELMDAFYGQKAESDRVHQQLGNILHRLRHDYERNEQKIEKLQHTLKEADDAEILRQKGELLTTFLYQVPKGATSVTLNNYYDNDQPLTIDLNPAHSPNVNAQKYFQRYQKLKKGAKIVQEQIEQTISENHYIESVIDQLERATPMDIAVIEEELVSQGYLKPKDKKRKMKQKSQPLIFISSHGHRILVGRNNLQNDQLTLKMAQKNHYWFHAKNIPGSHVILETAQPTDEEVTEAATLAAYYSKYRHSAQVPVDVIQVKHIRKPNGAKPGFVVYEGQRTVLVTPTKEAVEAMVHDA